LEDKMSNWPAVPPAQPPLASLHTPLGDLVFVRIAVEPRHLEALLEALARLQFPINPELRHNAEEGPDGRKLTLVEFPAYAASARLVGEELRFAGFDPASVRVVGMLEALQSLPAPPFPVS
jgi:hypothetical protein